MAYQCINTVATRYANGSHSIHTTYRSRAVCVRRGRDIKLDNVGNIRSKNAILSSYDDIILWGRLLQPLPSYIEPACSQPRG